MNVNDFSEAPWSPQYVSQQIRVYLKTPWLFRNFIISLKNKESQKDYIMYDVLHRKTNSTVQNEKKKEKN